VGEVVLAEKLPRTASNKVMRRVIRDEYLHTSHK
jgi:acyl-coenzyme A synthetase/AMP-(fatty) acid ligase